MSLSEEKLLILKMLEESKITSEEAAKLIDAIDNDPKQATSENTAKQQKQNNFQDDISKMKDRSYQWKKDFKDNYKQKDYDHIIDDFSSKAEKLGKNVATTTFEIVDKVVDFVGSFVDTNAFNFFGTCPIVEKSYESAAIADMELSVEGTNGQITLKKHSENRILIKTKIRSHLKSVENVIVYEEEDKKVTLKLNKVNNLSVSHEIYLPALKFKSISLLTTNGKIFVEDSLSEEFDVATRNGHIELMGVNSNKIDVKTKNAKILISYVVGKDIDINTNNSIIDIKHIKAENLKAVTANGRILVENVQNYDNSNEITLNLKTSNGAIKVNMNDTESRGYKVKAQTTNGGVNILIPEMLYRNVNKNGLFGSFAEAESSGYGDYVEKVSINVETANGGIEIIK